MEEKYLPARIDTSENYPSSPLSPGSVTHSVWHEPEKRDAEGSFDMGGKSLSDTLSHIPRILLISYSSG